MGIQARTVATGAQCLAEAPKCRPDMVLFDLDLIFAEGINSAALRQKRRPSRLPADYFPRWCAGRQSCEPGARLF